MSDIYLKSAKYVAEKIPFIIYNDKGQKRLFCPKGEPSRDMVWWFITEGLKRENTYICEFSKCKYKDKLEECKLYRADKVCQSCME